LKYSHPACQFRGLDYARYIVLFQGHADWASGTSKAAEVPSPWGGGGISAAE